ncbi:hypothetical protein [Phenylobacterium sp.]|uniref:hypothetical protein n=1 Tax=Phenylobacterium sp. TaxID=1871053 RepID=UPI003D2941EF
MFVIEDDIHADQMSKFEARADALVELRRLAAIPWDQDPNTAPCTNWRNCGREYRLIEYDTTTMPWREVASTPALNISAAGMRWLLPEG